MKTYVLMVSEVFPKNHSKSGENTCFPELITAKLKIHTIRSNYELWNKRIKEVNDGKAILSVRHWEGKPYRTKQIEIIQFDKDSGIGIEKLTFSSGQFNCMFVNGSYCFADIEKSIAKNDGLGFEDFREWFKNYNLNEPMAIIHFTKFRYDR